MFFRFIAFEQIFLPKTIQINSPNMWTCKNCGEEVPDNFSICWNCQYENGSDIIPEIPKEEAAGNTIILESGKQVDFNQIVSAGKQLKQAIITYLIFAALSLLLWLLAEAANWSKLYILIILLGILGHIIILSKIYYAGSALQKSMNNAHRK
jgi:hypothetical protein